MKVRAGFWARLSIVQQNAFPHNNECVDIVVYYTISIKKMPYKRIFSQYTRHHSTEKELTILRKSASK